ncbi:MAG: RNA-binding S4 domain-containing protein [Planktomarina sp.]|nr:RNA-binding S4 domain-containing protein [Planktomarina sp.]
MSEAKPGLRIDKWLWQARFFKTRSLAAKLVQSGKLRLNGDLISKPSRMVSEGDVLTFPKALDTRVIEVRALGTRRGPAPEAQGLYRDLAPPEPKPAFTASPKAAHRPTARERRAIQKFKQGLEEN